MVTTPQASFQYRMGAGIPGDINRTHPVTSEPNLNDATYPVALPGLACTINAAKNGVRSFQAGDTALTSIWGVASRAFPIQDTGAGETYGGVGFGNGPLPVSAAIDVVRDGYIMAQVPAGQTPGKGDACYIWCAASTGNHVQSGFENAASGGNTAAITNAVFNGAPDSNGYVEVIVRKA
jgi:hypothetical protein